jgi:predicted component of type VI protein secretion system
VERRPSERLESELSESGFIPLFDHPAGGPCFLSARACARVSPDRGSPEALGAAVGGELSYVLFLLDFVHRLEAIHWEWSTAETVEAERALNRWLKRFSHPCFDDWGERDDEPPDTQGPVPLSKAEVSLGEASTPGARAFRLRVCPNTKRMGRWFHLSMTGELRPPPGLRSRAPITPQS